MRSIFLSLAEEHRILLRLADAVEAAWKRDDERAVAAVRRALLILHRALERHEEIEETLFPGRRRVAPEAAPIAALVKAQHREIGALRHEVEALLGRADAAGGENLKTLSLVLVRRLRAHFETEESRLWPLFGALPGRSVFRTLARRARSQVQSLERDVSQYRAVVDTYL